MCDSAENVVAASSSLSSKDVIGTNIKRKEGKNSRNQRNAGSNLHVHDAHMRLNFLHQAAMHLSCQSTGIDDGYAKLVRRYTKLFRDVLKTERVKVMPDIIQTFCRNCKQMFVAKVKRFELTLVQCKLIQSECILCGYKRNYEWKMDYLSRNQKYWKSDNDQE